MFLLVRMDLLTFGFTYFLKQFRNNVLVKTLQKHVCERFRHALHRQIAYGGQFQVSVLPGPTLYQVQCQK